MKQVSIIIYYLTLSIVAAALLSTLAFFSSSKSTDVSLNNMLLLGGVFIISCLFGISLAVHPGWFKRSKISHIPNTKEKQAQQNNRRRRGHHPDCTQFQAHTITIKNKTICSGCLGLSIGSILSIFLMIIYMFTSSILISPLFYYLLILGFIIIGLVYIEILLPTRYTIIHIVSNGSLIIGFLLITISIVEITNNIIYGLLSIVLSFLWLNTRIQLSTYRHSLICYNCDNNCKMY